MRAISFAVLTAASLAVATSSAIFAQSDGPRSQSGRLPYPADVSLVNLPPNGWTFRENVTNLPLYVYDKDPPGKSVCTRKCASEWQPLVPTESTAKPLGEWSLIERSGGERQWAFKNKPVYKHVHDTPEEALGEKAKGGWHLLPYFD